MALGNLFRGRGRKTTGPMGVAIRVKAHNVPGAEEQGRAFPAPIWWALLLAAVFYVLAHASIVTGVWPVHGISPGAGGTLIRDGVALVAWGVVLFALRLMKYRGRWPIVVLPVLIFCLARPSQFQAFTDPSYQGRGEARAAANESKATRSRLSTIERVYSQERKEAVYQGPPPPLPDPFERAVARETASRGFLSRSMTYLPVFIAPLVLLVGFLLSRNPGNLRWFREHRLIPYLPTLAVFFALTLFFTASSTGKVGGTTPWELFLPVFIATWAATLADDAYNLQSAGQAFQPRRLLWLFVYGALPVVPFLVIRELGLSIVLAGSLAVMLLVGTRRGWWGALLLAVWGVLVVIAFNVDPRSQTRLQLAYDPYKDLSTMAPPDQQKWADKLHQFKLFDANVTTGGLLGEGPGRGHGETAPNAADDGYITLIAAQWGWAGAVSLVLLYTVFLVQLLSAAARERSAFERTLVTGLAMLIGIPFWLATLGGIRIIPLTGVATAFAAHGGAKLLASAFAVGIIAGISHLRHEREALDAAVARPEPEGGAEGIRIR
jgi:cell division protein FtsW (lipid II flippase)